LRQTTSCEASSFSLPLFTSVRTVLSLVFPNIKSRAETRPPCWARLLAHFYFPPVDDASSTAPRAALQAFGKFQMSTYSLGSRCCAWSYLMFAMPDSSRFVKPPPLFSLLHRFSLPLLEIIPRSGSIRLVSISIAPIFYFCELSCSYMFIRSG